MTKTPVNVTSRRGVMDENVEVSATVILAAAEREIAIGVLGSRGLSSPEEAAKSLLAGVAVLDGKHSPFVIWPAESTRRQRAEWHAKEAVYWMESADHFDARMLKLNLGEGQNPEESAGSQQGPSESGGTARYPASTPSALPEAGTNSRPLESCAPDQGSSDAC